MEKCAYHDELKSDVEKLNMAMVDSLQRQSAWQVSLDNVIDLLRDLRDEQKRMVETLNKTITETHRDFVTKKEFELLKEITRGDIESVRKGSLKIMAIIFSVGGAVMALIQWVISLITGG